VVFSQTGCKDAIYPQDGSKIIVDCCVLEIRGGNEVLYCKDGDTLSMTARAVSKSGAYFELQKDQDQVIEERPKLSDDSYLYKGHNYDYYQNLYYRAGIQQGFGIFLSILGVGLEVTGVVMANKGELYSSSYETGTKLIWVGSFCEIFGIPLWISGGIRKANNRKAMEEIDHLKSLTFGRNPDGIGLSYKF
jgi:hypothetical protein